MKQYILITTILILLFTGCKKDDTTGPSNPVSNVFTTSNVKISPVYFNFSNGDSVSSTDIWDIKLTNGVFDSSDHTNSYPFPGIILNPNTDVQAKFVDGQSYDNVDPSSITGLKKDVTGYFTFSTNNIKNSSVYFNFSLVDTVASSQDWDIKFTVDAFRLPLLILNRTKNVQATIQNNVTNFASFNHFLVGDTLLKTDLNDTTFAIGSECLSYDMNTHLLNPYPNRVFVIKTSNGEKIKLQLQDYYKTPGTYDASGYITFTYYSKGKENYAIGTNCLNYDENSHHLDPYTNRTFVVKTHDGKFAKFKMLTYYNDTGASGYMKFEYEVK